MPKSVHTQAIKQDVANAMDHALMPGGSEKYYRDEIAKLTHTYGPKDNRVAYAQICLARLLLTKSPSLYGDYAFNTYVTPALTNFAAPYDAVPSDFNNKLRDVARAYEEAKDYKHAIPPLKVGVELYPLMPVSDTLSNLESELADAYDQSGEHEKGLEMMKAALKYSDRWGVQYYNGWRARWIGEKSADLKRWDDAESYMKRAVDLLQKTTTDVDENAWANWKLGDIYMRQGKYAQAIDPFQRAAKLREPQWIAGNTDYWWPELGLAAAYFGTGDMVSYRKTLSDFKTLTLKYHPTWTRYVARIDALLKVSPDGDRNETVNKIQEGMPDS